MIPIKFCFSVVFLPKLLDLFYISYSGSLLEEGSFLFCCNLFWLLALITLLFLRPDLDLLRSPFLLMVPFLGFVELSTRRSPFSFSLSLSSYSSSSFVLSPSKNLCIRACLAVSLSLGSIFKRPFIISNPSGLSLLPYFFYKVSGLDTVGNLKPMKRGFWLNCSC